MKATLTSRDEATLSVLREQINQCRSEITSYNLQFLATSALNTIMAGFAVVLSGNTSIIRNLLYIFPTMALLHLYNLIKYTREMCQLSAYRLVLEHLANQYLNENILCWEITFQGYRDSAKFSFLTASGQVFFIIPVAIFIFSGFMKMAHDWLWYVIFICLIVEAIFLIYMAFDLMKAKKESLANLGYTIVNGELVPLKK